YEGRDGEASAHARRRSVDLGDLAGAEAHVERAVRRVEGEPRGSRQARQRLFEPARLAQDCDPRIASATADVYPAVLSVDRDGAEGAERQRGRVQGGRR